jgi:hypothetical protein
MNERQGDGFVNIADLWEERTPARVLTKAEQQKVHDIQGMIAKQYEKAGIDIKLGKPPTSIYDQIPGKQKSSHGYSNHRAKQQSSTDSSTK